MGQAERVEQIKQLESNRGSRLICYVTGDRQPGLETRIGMDVFPYFYEILAEIKKTKRIDLLLYSTGGAIMAAWGLVNLLREFCDELGVLIPYKAQSSATLIALGANEIVMSKTGQLSPVDPTITSPFNPVVPNQAPGTPPQFLPVSVEDVIGYLELARKEGHLESETAISDILKSLAADVRPLALGSVYRAKEQIRMLSRKLLGFHMATDEISKIDSIVAALTRELYSHDYVIARKEAKEVLGLKVSDCSEDLEHRIMELFFSYSKELQLNKGYNSQVELGERNTKVINLDRAFIESADKSFVFRTKREVKKVKVKQEGVQIEGIQERLLEEGWQPA